MSSPILPFPRVANVVSVPSSYVATIVQPSSFHMVTAFLSRVLKSFGKREISFVFSRDNAGYSCVMVVASLFTSAPAIAVGEFGNTTPVFCSNAVSSSYNWSYS